MKSFQRSVLAAALALAALPAAAQTFSQTVFFGDSLTDSGNFQNFLPPSVRPVTGRFTTNPGLVWAEFLADYYGTSAQTANQGGPNYAVGGARTGTNTSATLAPGLTVPVPSLATQANTYLAANGGRADANALYTVWGGANDLFFATTQPPASAPAIIGAAVTAQVGTIGQLSAAGARYILVPTVPDLGLTPSFRAQGAAIQAQGTALASNYNAALFGALDSAGLRVIPLNTFAFLQEIVANPGQFGILNVTGTACQPQITAQSLTCNPTSYVNPGAPETYLFADGVHPTLAGHRAIGQYATSVIEAPRQIALLPHSAAVVGNARAERVAAQLEDKQEDGMRWWADVRGDSQRFPESGTTDGFDGGGASLGVGVNWTSGNLVYGGFGGYGRQSIDYWARRGEFDQTDATLGGVLGWRAGAGYINGQLSWTRLDYDVDREVRLGAATRIHSGSPSGENLSLGVSAGWDFEHGSLHHGPIARLLSQRIDVDGYTENSTESTALAFPDQSYDSLIGSLGWQVSFHGSEHLRPYARASYQKEFEESPEEAFAQLVSLPDVAPYAVPGLGFDESFGVVQFGAKTELFGLDLDLGAVVTVAQKGGNDATVYATFGGGF